MANIIITIILESQLSNCCLNTLQTKTDQQVNPSSFFSTGTITSYGVCASVSINGIVLYRTVMREVFISSATCWSRDSSCPAELHPKMQQSGVGRWWSAQPTGSPSITHTQAGKSWQDPGFHKMCVLQRLFCSAHTCLHAVMCGIIIALPWLSFFFSDCEKPKS